MKLSRISKNIALLILNLIVVLPACRFKESSVVQLNEQERAWIKEHDELVLAVDNTYPPLNYLDENGQMAGLNIDLIQLISERLDLDIRLEGSNWNEALAKAMNHEVDGIINASPLEERKSRLNFTHEFFKDPLALVTYKENEIKSFDNIRYQRIAAKRGSQHLQLLSEKISPHLIIPINTLDEGIELLSLKKIDGIYDDLAPLYHMLSSNGLSHLKVGFVEPNNIGSRIGVRNNDVVLLGLLNKAIKSIETRERLQIQNKWLGFSPKRNYTVYYIIIGILLTVVLLISFWSWSLKVMVNKRTVELEEELRWRKEAEEQLIKAKEKAEESDRLKSAFLANISHEIRTPMNSVFGFSELLQENNFSKAEQSKYLSLILSSAKQLLSIINDLVHISKLEANLIQVYKNEVNVRKMLEELAAMFKLETDRKDIELSFECDEGSYHFDEVKVKQVLTNLISNALKNTEEGYVKFGMKLEGAGSLMFYVKDSGVGIKSDDHINIFNRFWQVKNDANESGTGLGLAISKAHVEMMGGRIWLDSKLGEGSTFYFTIEL